MSRLDGTVSVVTGGGRGIGRQIAITQAQEGATVAVLARNQDEIEKTARLIEDAGGRAIALPVDLTRLGAVEEAMAHIERTLGPIDLLMNNHGSFRAFGPIWECDPDEWWQDVEINLRGTFHACRAALPAMRARGRGRVVNMVGGGTGTSFPAGSGYASSKAAVMRFTECLNDTLVPDGLRAFATDPGLVRTAMTELQLETPQGQAHLPGIQDMFASGEDVPPTLVADVVADIAAGRFDALAGRLLRGADDRDALERRMQDIAAADQRALRFSGL